MTCRLETVSGLWVRSICAKADLVPVHTRVRERFDPDGEGGKYNADDLRVDMESAQKANWRDEWKCAQRLGSRRRPARASEFCTTAVPSSCQQTQR